MRKRPQEIENWVKDMNWKSMDEETKWLKSYKVGSTCPINSYLTTLAFSYTLVIVLSKTGHCPQSNDLPWEKREGVWISVAEALSTEARPGLKTLTKSPWREPQCLWESELLKEARLLLSTWSICTGWHQEEYVLRLLATDALKKTSL